MSPLTSDGATQPSHDKSAALIISASGTDDPPKKIQVSSFEPPGPEAGLKKRPAEN
jgi:hypothetical protein